MRIMSTNVPLLCALRFGLFDASIKAMGFVSWKKTRVYYFLNKSSTHTVICLGVLGINFLAIMTPNSVKAAPLDYEIGNVSVRSCKLVYSDGRPDEPLPSCEGTKDFGNATGTFKVKVVMTNEINQDVESVEIDVNGSCAAINPAEIAVGFPVGKLVGCQIFYAYNAPAYAAYTTYDNTGPRGPYVVATNQTLSRSQAQCTGTVVNTETEIYTKQVTFAWSNGGSVSLYPQCMGWYTTTYKAQPARVIPYPLMSITTGTTQSAFDTTVSGFLPIIKIEKY